MISCIIAAYREPRTVGAAIQSFIAQPWSEEYELLVVCPDPETQRVIRIFTECYTQVQHITDNGEGKPAALNLAIARAQGEICIFSDGDVVVQGEAINALLAPFSNPHCGAVTGRPLSDNPRSTMLGYWSHLLTDAGAHTLRLQKSQSRRYLDCSGYLYAVRRELLAPLPDDTLADDSYISQLVWQQGYDIVYVPDARVVVHYPTTYHDWLLQKVRSGTGATNNPQPLQATDPAYRRPPAKMRSFLREIAGGLSSTLRYARSWRERWWTCCLLLARIHLWLCVWMEIHIKHRSFQEIWQRVETTKYETTS